MFNRTFSSLADDARALTDRARDPSLENEVLAPWINQEIRKVWAIAAQMAPDHFTKVSNAFPVAANGTFSVGAGGADGVSDFLYLRGVDYSSDGGVNFVRLQQAKFMDRGRVPRVAYYLRGFSGARTLLIQPKELATAFTYRYHYVFAPPELLTHGSSPVAPVDSIDLPLGADDYVAQGVAARIRVRYEEDPILHLAAQRAALETMQRFFGRSFQGEPEVIRGADESDDDSGWW